MRERVQERVGRVGFAGSPLLIFPARLAASSFHFRSSPTFSFSLILLLHLSRSCPTAFRPSPISSLLSLCLGNTFPLFSSSTSVLRRGSSHFFPFLYHFSAPPSFFRPSSERHSSSRIAAAHARSFPTFSTHAGVRRKQRKTFLCIHLCQRVD